MTYRLDATLASLAWIAVVVLDANLDPKPQPQLVADLVLYPYEQHAGESFFEGLGRVRSMRK